MENLNVFTAVFAVAVPVVAVVASLVIFGGYGLILSGVLLSVLGCCCDPERVDK